MLDRLFFRYLSRKGKYGYFIGQFVFLAGYLYYLFGYLDMSLGQHGSEQRSSTELAMYGGLLVFIVLWGVICVKIWPSENGSHTKTEKTK